MIMLFVFITPTLIMTIFYLKSELNYWKKVSEIQKEMMKKWWYEEK